MVVIAVVVDNVADEEINAGDNDDGSGDDIYDEADVTVEFTTDCLDELQGTG